MSADFEDIVSNLSSFTVSNEENCVSSRIDLYKTKTSKQDQESRRANLLERQKSDREKTLAVLRNIESDEQERRKENPFKNQLMLSEWLDHQPEDFAENWLFKIAPVGHRTLIVAQRGKTYSYTKNGYRTATFISHLPGGNKSSKSGSTILDGIWCEGRKCFYILDIISFKSHPVVNSETDFRFYWGSTKFAEDLPNIGTEARHNTYPMFWLPHFPCNKESLAGVCASMADAEYDVDGVLFYHKLGHYTAGATPLVGWLKPVMLNNVLHLDIDLTKYQEEEL